MDIIKKHLPILSVVMIFAILGGLTGKIIFATDNTPTLIIGGKSTKVDTIFTEDIGKWYPGCYVSKTLKVKNNQRFDVVIDNISMEINLNKNNTNIDLESPIGRDYLDNMELKIELRDKKFFKKPSSEILYDGNFKNFLSGIEPNINIEGKVALDLVYTIGMNINASENIEGIDGIVDFVFRVQQDLDTDSRDDPVEDGEIIWLEDKKTPVGAIDIEGHWAHDCIITLLENGIIKGYPNGSIRPEDNITRAEAAALVGRSIDVEKVNTAKLVYNDKLPNWASDYILALTNLGVLEGYGNGEFKANNHITREEMVKLLVLAFEKEMLSGPEIKFLDKNDIGNWAINYVRIGVTNKIIEGYPDSTFRPKANITRGETFTIICKLLGLHEKHINE